MGIVNPQILFLCHTVSQLFCNWGCIHTCIQTLDPQLVLINSSTKQDVYIVHL